MNTPEKSTSRYGIRVSLAPTDPFAALVGEDWQKTHWFTAQAERDRVMRDMAREHEYSRRGDKPTLIFEAVSRTTDS